MLGMGAELMENKMDSALGPTFPRYHSSLSFLLFSHR